MVLVIPMSGQGKRFLAEGYKTPKPIIQIEGKPAISHVLDLYPEEKSVVFICNEEHLQKTPLEKILLDLKPSAKIASIKYDEKFCGPVVAIKQAYDLILDDEEVMVSYCDFTGKWDYKNFKKTVREKNVDGAIQSYVGFHPHMLGPNLYGHMTCDEKDLLLFEIREKECFTDNKMQEYTASGAYWYKSGRIMKDYFDKAISLNLRTRNEFFCSLPYNLMVKDGLKVLIYEMEKFCQWGTPEDLEEYEAWSRTFAVLSGKPEHKGKTEIPGMREKFVKCRETSAENLQKTFKYWQEYFSEVKWHPYGK